MQTARDLIPATAEFTAGMQHCENDLQRRLSRLRLNIYGDAAAIVRHGDGIAGVDRHGNVGAEARQSFVNGIIYDLIDQMVQTTG